MADYTGIWRYLFDWQTLIAGLVAFGGAWLAYRGVRVAADRQIAAIHEQLRQEREAAAERDRCERKGLVEGLSIEAARIRELAAQRFATAQQEYVGDGKPGWVQVDRARVYMIDARGLRAGRSPSRSARRAGRSAISRPRWPAP